MNSNLEGIIKDENGLFVFGPWWFVIIVMVLGVIASIFRNNTPKNNNNNTKQIMDYEPIEKSTNNLENHNKCPNCGNKNSLTSKFCNGCGVSLNINNNSFCPECGEKNSKYAKYCKECGNELDII